MVTAISPWIDILEECNELSLIALSILRNCAENSTVEEMTRQHVKDAEKAVFTAYQCLQMITDKQYHAIYDID